MMGRHRYATRLYYQLSLDDLVPKKHLLRRIAEAIDFSFVYQMARPYYSCTGQPSIDPVVPFKSLPIGYIYCIRSERWLLGEVQVNMAHRWFLGYDLDEPVPDHSVLSKARVRFGMQVFEAFFTKTVDLCKDAGLANGETTFVDSTFIRANAAMKSLESAADHEPPLPPRQYVKRLFEENAGNEPPELDQPTSSACRRAPSRSVAPRARGCRPTSANAAVPTRTPA
jgi:transposase